MLHVLPIEDLKEHLEDSTCECCPEIRETEDGSLMCIHRSYDRREVYEHLPLEILCKNWLIPAYLMIEEEKGLKRLKYLCECCTCSGMETGETKELFLELNNF